VFVFLLVVATAVILGFVTWHSEVSIRSAGYALQLIGMIFAISGLLGIRTHFRQPLLRELLFSWFKRFPKWKRSVVISAGTVHATSAGMRARVEVWTPDDPSQPIEKRIENICKNLERIREEQREHAKLIDEVRDSHKEHKKKITEDSKKMVEEIRSDLEALHTSDLLNSLVGLLWLTIGITMSTMAPELFQRLY
jgi:hypothetical protein